MFKRLNIAPRSGFSCVANNDSFPSKFRIVTLSCVRNQFSTVTPVKISEKCGMGDKPVCNSFGLDGLDPLGAARIKTVTSELKLIPFSTSTNFLTDEWKAMFTQFLSKIRVIDDQLLIGGIVIGGNEDMKIVHEGELNQSGKLVAVVDSLNSKRVFFGHRLINKLTKEMTLLGGLAHRENDRLTNFKLLNCSMVSYRSYYPISESVVLSETIMDHDIPLASQHKQNTFLCGNILVFVKHNVYNHESNDTRSEIVFSGASITDSAVTFPFRKFHTGLYTNNLSEQYQPKVVNNRWLVVTDDQTLETKCYDLKTFRYGDNRRVKYDLVTLTSPRGVEEILKRLIDEPNFEDEKWKECEVDN